MRKIFKELHLWLSLPLGIVMAVTCFSGAMLIFEKEITESIQKEYYFVDKVSDDALSFSQIIEKVQPTLDKGVEITGIVVSNDPERCYKLNLSKPNRAAVYVDQYSGELKGQPERLAFFRTMFRLRRWLMDSRPADGGIFWGKMIVGVSTLLMVIVLITGIVIWIPKNIKGLKNRLSIKVGNGWRRFWYDLHVAGGIYAVLLLLAMALTGLTWSFEWYRNGFYKVFGVEMTKNNGNNSNKQKTQVEDEQKTPYLHWEEVYKKLSMENPESKQITISKGSATVSVDAFGNKRASDKYKFDNASGEIISKELYSDAAKSSKIRGVIYSVHVGNWGGMITRVLWFLAAMIGAALPLTGYYLFFKRKFGKK